MKLKSFLLRFLFCLPFIAIVFHVQSYHGELVNNAKATWQYLQNAEGNVYLAIDVYSPSGIKIDGIFSRGRNITGSWQLVNYPDWYKGRENFKKLSEFQGVLHPYLPYNKDFNILYTNGWYTFLYEWRPKKPIPMPPEASLRIKYQNVSTQNHYNAGYVLGIKVISEVIKDKVSRPVVFWQVLYPESPAYKYSKESKLRIVLNNLIINPDFLEYALADPDRSDYSIYIEGEEGESLDLLKGFVKRDSEGVYQVYSKINELEENRKTGIDFNEILRHLAAIIFMAYFVIICWFTGIRFVKWRGIVLDNHAAKTVIPIFLGIILLTYLFFIIGILQLLYFPIIFIILLVILFFGFESTRDVPGLKTIFINELTTIKKNPWRIIFWAILLGMLFYNLSYCFIPAAYPDGSGDIVTSYLPIINDYIISHSFNAPIYNSTIGIIPQALDVLRTVAKMFIGESGVYLLSFVYLLLILGTIYLITSDIFKVNNSLIYLAILLLLSGYVFTEFIHFGKHHIAILSFLLISLYSIRFFDNNKNYILIAIFLIFLSSCPFFYLILVALTFYLFIFGYSFYEYKTIKAPIFRLHMKSLIIFFIFCSIFYLKLIFDVGICYPPWILPASVSDFFLKINYNNGFFKYIDNNYIRHYYEFSHLTLSKNNLKYLKLLYENLNFYPILLFFPFLFKKTDRYKNLYIIETIVMVCLLMIPYIYSDKSARLVIYYIFPLIILQFGIINDIMLSLKKTINRLLKIKGFFYLEAAFILLILSYLIFEGSPASFKIRKLRFIDNQAWRWVGEDYRALLYNNVFYNSPKKWFFREILPVFLGKKSKYMYLKAGYPFPTPNRNFDHCMLIRQYTNTKDTILIVPVRFHSYAMRHITARHALGSVIYQRDINNIMSDLKKLSIGYLSYIPMHYHDYNPFYTPIFEDGVFYKYFKLLFSDDGSSLYKIIYDGTNKEYSPSPYDVKGLPFIPMQETEDKI